MIYDPLYSKPLTGELDKDGFKTSPNAFLMEVMKGITTGDQALDVGAGMGRNAIHLAGLGWDVTGIDLSAKGLEVMQANAEKAGLNVQTVKTSYEDFDFGRDRWDLVAMILSWAPVEEAGFLARLKTSIRPGGYVRLDPSPPVQGLRPSANVLFDSASKAYRDGAVGIILTGMGEDGADGLQTLRQAGGYVLAQDEASCVIFGMPKAAIDRGIVDRVLPPDQIAATLRRIDQLNKSK